MKNLTPELIEKAKAAGSAEELLALAKENGVEMTAAEAAAYFAQLNPKNGELSDDDLDAVSGGACQNADYNLLLGKMVRITTGQTCKKCGTNIGKVENIPYGYLEALAAVCQNCSEGRHVYDIAYIEDGNYEIVG